LLLLQAEPSAGQFLNIVSKYCLSPSSPLFGKGEGARACDINRSTEGEFQYN
jgi:hypothetical protein